MSTEKRETKSPQWRREEVLKAISEGSRDAKLQRLRRAGIIDEKNQLRDEYKKEEDLEALNC